MEDPHADLRRLRETDPVLWSPAVGGWVLTRFADVVVSLKDADTFGNAGRTLRVLDHLSPTDQAQLSAFRGHYESRGLIHSDPPDHTRIRRLVLKAFTPPAIEAMRPVARQPRLVPRDTTLGAMLDAGTGSVINVASAQGIVGWSGFSAYSASKGAITSLTRQLANEYGARGIRFNALVPGAVMTPMNEARIRDAGPAGPAMMEASANLHIIPRYQQPAEVAAAIALLASDDASFVTGSTMVVDGGCLVKGH